MRIDFFCRNNSFLIFFIESDIEGNQIIIRNNNGIRIRDPCGIDALSVSLNLTSLSVLNYFTDCPVGNVVLTVNHCRNRGPDSLAYFNLNSLDFLSVSVIERNRVSILYVNRHDICVRFRSPSRINRFFCTTDNPMSIMVLQLHRSRKKVPDFLSFYDRN